MPDVFIRSFHDFAMTFGEGAKAIKIPSRTNQTGTKNVVQITQEQFEWLLTIPEFDHLLNHAKFGNYRKLDAMPRDALDAQERIAQAQQQVIEAFAERDRLANQKAAAEAELERLKADVEAQGGFDVPAEVAKAREEADGLKAELEAMKAELDALKAKKAPKAKE